MLLDAFLPKPRLREVDSVDVGVPLDEAYEAIERLDLGDLPIARALFAARAIPDRLAGRASAPSDLRLTSIVASTHGFRLLSAEAGHGVVVGAIGRVWEPSIPFMDVPSDAYAAFAEPGWAKVAWELRADAITPATSRITMEVRVTTTDDASWPRFQHYFAVIGPFSRLMRKMMLGAVGRRLGAPERVESTMSLPGDALIPHARATHTDAITIDASPSRVWPWLVQIGAERAGWYSYDWLDNGGAPSAESLDPRYARVETGQLIHALPGSLDGFTVASVDAERSLVLAAAVDLDADRPLSVGAEMPHHYWRVSWAFVLEPTHDGGTRLLVRVRGDWSPDRLVWRARVGLTMHRFMEHEQLRNLKRRAEGRRSAADDASP
jgi:hypothetical protein